MAKVIARRVVELGSVICVVAGGPTGAIVASDWLPQKILNLSKKAALEKWLQLYGTGQECPRFALLENICLIKQLNNCSTTIKRR